MILNSTARVGDTPEKLKQKSNLIANCSIINTTAPFSTMEEGELTSTIDKTLSPIKKSNCDGVCDNNKDDDDEDCILVEKIIEPIVIDDDTTPNIEEDQTEPVFFEDTTGMATLKFSPHQMEHEQKSSANSSRRSCTAVLNSSDVIVLDETGGSSSKMSIKAHKSLDDSVLFVSESTLDFIPLESDDVRKICKVVRNPFSPKPKKTQQPSNDTFFSKSEKQALAAYNFNSYNPKIDEDKAALKQQQKRMVIIDGNNVAYGYSRNKEFDVKGLQICIEYFKQMGHEVKAVVPQMRLKKRFSTDPSTLDKLHKEGVVILTPCKSIPGNSSISYDDRIILQLASQMDAAIVSNDNYRDLINENAAFKKLILNRVIGYTWVNDLFIVPQDPYGKRGTTLREILNRNPSKNA